MAFALLTSAMATNVFLLQPSTRLIATAPTEQGARTETGWALKQEPASGGRDVAAANPAAVVPALETGAVKAANRPDLVKAIQRELKAKNYETGAVDGVAGLVTRGAIMAYESDAGLPLSGEPSSELLQHLVLGSSQSASAAASGEPGQEAQAVIRAVQNALRQLGYLASAPDGALNDVTRRAIRKFEADRKLKQTGRISGELLAKLATLANDALQTAMR